MMLSLNYLNIRYNQIITAITPIGKYHLCVFILNQWLNLSVGNLDPNGSH